MGVIIAALVAFGGFLGLFHAIVGVVSLSCIQSVPDLHLVSPVMDLLIIAGCLLVAWLLGFYQRSVTAIRHVGTRFYGRKRIEQGYITTKWLVAGFPLLPIRSFVILYPLKQVANGEYEFQQNIMRPVDGYFEWAQMLRTALISYGTIAWCLGCLWLMFMGPCT